MLLVKLCEPPRRRLFRRRELPARRFSAMLGGRPFTVLETSEEALGEPAVLRLLAANRCRTLFPLALALREELRSFAFDPRPYRLRALTAALVAWLRCRGGTPALTVRGARAYDLLQEAVPYVRRLTVVAPFDAAAAAFRVACYDTYGVHPRFVPELSGSPAGLFADFSAVVGEGSLPVFGTGEPYFLPAPRSWYALPPEAGEVLSWGISPTSLAAALHD